MKTGLDAMTYEEKSLLADLAKEDQDDRDCIPERYLVGSGYAERYDTGMLRITAKGRALFGEKG